MIILIKINNNNKNLKMIKRIKKIKNYNNNKKKKNYIRNQTMKIMMKVKIV